MPLGEARRTVDELKREIRREIGVVRVYAHVEPSMPDAQPASRLAGDEGDLIAAAREAVRGVAGDRHEVVVYRQGGRLLVVTSVTADPLLSVREAHALASRVEDVVRERLAGVDDVIVEVT
jgi:divalent metal cation (Fe/Co/Zn/Cd) transporter